MSRGCAHLYVEMTEASNERGIATGDGRSDANRTPTRFEDFADRLAQAYRAG